MYKKVSTELNFVSRELEIVDLWKKNDIFKKAQAAGGIILILLGLKILLEHLGILP